MVKNSQIVKTQGCQVRPGTFFRERSHSKLIGNITKIYLHCLEHIWQRVFVENITLLGQKMPFWANPGVSDVSWNFFFG